MSLSVRPRLRLALLSLLGLSLLGLASEAEAVGTRYFQLESLDDFRGGDLAHVSVDATGTLRPGLRLGSLPLPDATSAWSSLVLPDGSVLLGTGSDGQVYKVSHGSTTLVATTGELAVASLAFAWDGSVIAGTFPEGKVFRVNPEGHGETATLLTKLEQAEDVWSLAYDPKERVAYAATGPEGKLFRIDDQGKASVYFDSEEPHLTSLAIDSHGTLYVGSYGKALLYRLRKAGLAPEVSVLQDFDADEVKALVLGRSSPSASTPELFAIVNRYPEPFQPPKRGKGSTLSPQPAKAGRPGKGKLIRFDAQGASEELLSDEETHFVSLALGEDGLIPYVGTGAEGRVYSVDADHLVRLVADTDERQVGALALGGPSPFVVTTDPVVFHEILIGGPVPVWTSKVLDAGLRARFGRVTWKGTGAVDVSTRTGFTALPDATWSPWSEGSGASFDVKSPPGRYLQVRARFNKDATATLREVGISFLTDNLRPILSGLDAVPKGSSRPALRQGLAPSGAETPKPAPALRISWKVDNPDQDELRYRIAYRSETESAWRSLLRPGEKLSRNEYDWDVSTLPEGPYRLRVEVTDAPSNPADRARTHATESRVIVVDTTAPVFRSLGLQGRVLSGEVVDGASPIARIEVSLAGTDDGSPLFPADGILDEPLETFAVDLSPWLQEGPQTLMVRAWDAAGNMVAKHVLPH